MNHEHMSISLRELKQLTAVATIGRQSLIIDDGTYERRCLGARHKGSGSAIYFYTKRSSIITW